MESLHDKVNDLAVRLGVTPADVVERALFVFGATRETIEAQDPREKLEADERVWNQRYVLNDRANDQIAMHRIATALQDTIRAHELIRHAGDVCYGERLGALAFLAHRLGWTAQGWQVSQVDFTNLLKRYDAEHERHHGKEAACRHT